jgi:hypothetical protein
MEDFTMRRRILIALLVLLLLAVSVGAAAAQSSSALWFYSYWNNPDQKGDPVFTGSEGVINHDWGNGSPDGRIAKDSWSARWTAYVDFAPGTYRFTVINDDGARVYLGDKHIISDWQKHQSRTNVATVSLKGGRYPMAVDYFQDTGRALLKLAWERIGEPSGTAGDVAIIASGQVTPAPAPSPVSPGTWYASYWNNTNQQGSPVLTRNEAAINYDWGNGSPDSRIANDNWSARWTGYFSFQPGTYRFTSVSDDGIRVYVNDRYVINNWTLHAEQTDTGTITLAGGTYPVAVDYFDHTNRAVAKVWWERIDAPNPPASTVTATPVTSLRVRSGPSTAYQVLTVVPKGVNVPVLARTADGTWIKVQYRGVTGWMAIGYVTLYGDLNALPVGW